MTLVSGICRIIWCSRLLRCHTIDILVGCVNEVTIHGDVGDEALQGTCNLFGALTVATIAQSKNRHHPGVYV